MHCKVLPVKESTMKTRSSALEIAYLFDKAIMQADISIHPLRIRIFISV